MFRIVVLSLALLMGTSTFAYAQYPFRYSRSTFNKNTSRSIYYSRNNRIVGRSFNTRSGTYWRQNGRITGRSYTTKAGNTYFFRTR